MSRTFVTNHEAKRMRSLAGAGLSQGQIVKEIGRDHSTVKRHAGDLIDPKWRTVDLGRARVLIDAYAKATRHSDKVEVGRRLGYGSVKAFYNAVRKARCRLELPKLTALVTDDERDRLRAMARQGIDAVEIARRSGRAANTVRRQCQGVLVRGKPGPRTGGAEARS